MNRDVRIADLGSHTVLDSSPHHREPIPGPDEIAPPWNRCTIPGCIHSSCPAKLRAWGWYGKRYMCAKQGCDHVDCPPRLRAIEDEQPFGVFYDGPALPQHTISFDGRPHVPRMHAVRDEAGEWHLLPDADPQRP